MRLRNMLRICLVFWKSDPQYAYKCYACKKTCILMENIFFVWPEHGVALALFKNLDSPNLLFSGIFNECKATSYHLNLLHKN